MNVIHHRFNTAISELEYCDWLCAASPGEIVQYHSGFLVLDTDKLRPRLPEPERLALLRLGRRAWWAAEHELVHLVQRRLGANRFAYIAIRRSRPWPNGWTALVDATVTSNEICSLP